MKIGRVLQFVRSMLEESHVSDIQVDIGGEPIVTGTHYADPGDDSFPLEGDYAVMVRAPGSGKWSIVGYLDPINEPMAEAGERRFYSRDPSDGSVAATLWLKADSTIELGTAVDDFVALAGAVLDELEAVKTDLDNMKLIFDAHVHGGVTAGGGSTLAPAAPFPTPHTPASVASATVAVQS